MRTPAGPWYLARHDDVLAATQNIELFQASFREPGIVVPDEEQLINEIPEPRHGQVRRIINSAIAVHRLGEHRTVLRAAVQRPARRSVATRRDRSISCTTTSCRCRAASSRTSSAPHPPISTSGRPGPTKWCRARGPTTNRNERGVGLPGAHPEFANYVDELIATRRDDPRDDFVTRLLQSEVDGRALTDVEARTQLVFLFISRQRDRPATSSATCCGPSPTIPTSSSGCRADRELVPVAVEESLRHDPPIRFLLRNCMQARELHGEQLSPGDKVAFGLLSANRDESVFDDPHAFRLDRPDPRGHVAFGGGPHVCPGASVARLEARVALSVILDRVGAIRPVDPGVYEEVPVAWAHGPRRLDAVLSPTA